MAVSGSADAPVVVHRDEIALADDAALREPYHAAVGMTLDDAQASIVAAKEAAAAAAAATIDGFVSSIGALAAVGLVGANRTLTAELPRVLAKHALLHAYDTDLHERAIVEGATRAGLPVTTLPATGKLFDHASDVLGVPIGPSLAALGKSIGPPWQKNYREAAAAALVALAELPR